MCRLQAGGPGMSGAGGGDGGSRLSPQAREPGARMVQGPVQGCSRCCSSAGGREARGARGLPPPCAGRMTDCGRPARTGEAHHLPYEAH